MSLEAWGDENPFDVPDGYVTEELYSELQGIEEDGLRVLWFVYKTMQEAKNVVDSKSKAKTFMDSVTENVSFHLKDNIPKINTGEDWRDACMRKFDRGE